MKTRVLAASKHHSSAYAWYLSGLNSPHCGGTGVRSRPLRPFIYAAKQQTATGMQQAAVGLGANWSFWRIGLTAPGLVIVGAVLGLGFVFVDTCLAGCALVHLPGEAGQVRAILSSPLACYAALVTLRAARALWQARVTGNLVTRQEGYAAARVWFGGLLVLSVLAVAGLGGSFSPRGASELRVKLNSGLKSAACGLQPAWVDSQRCEAQRALLPHRVMRANSLGAEGAACFVTNVRGLAPQGGVSRASLLWGFESRLVPLRGFGLEPAFRGLAWPSLPSQLGGRATLVRTLASSWQFFLDAQANRAPSFNSALSAKPQQYSNGISLIAERAVLAAPVNMPLTAPSTASNLGSPLTGGELRPLTLRQRSGIGADITLQFLQTEGFLVKGKPWGRI